MSNVVGQETMILILYLLSSTTVISWSTKFDEMRQWLTKVITMAWHGWHIVDQGTTTVLKLPYLTMIKL